MAEINQLFYDLRNLQYDYADCKGEHGPILKKFSHILNRYHENYCLWEPITDEERTPPKSKNSLKSELIFIAIIAVLFWLFASVFEKDFLTAIFYIVAGILFASRRDNPALGVFSVSLSIAFMIVGNLFIDGTAGTAGAGAIVFSIFFIFYALAVVKQCISMAKKTVDHKSELKELESDLKKIEAELEADRKEMNKLLPQLFAEFKEKQQEIIENSSETIDGELLQMCSELPPLFWWQISPQELKAFEDNYSQSETDERVSWETRWVNRSQGKEFSGAGYEYSPLVEINDSSEEYKQIYDDVKAEFFADPSAGVFDFISRGSATTMDEEFFQYEEYAHSDFKRFSDKMLWAGVGNNIDNAKRNGEITDEQYAYLSSAYIFASPGVYSNIDEKVEKTGIKYRPVKVSTNIWVGQMLLVDDDRGDGIAVVDYRSQIPHIFKNIDSLEDVKITRIAGDPVKRNPMVMAKFHKVCELCR